MLNPLTLLKSWKLRSALAAQPADARRIVVGSAGYFDPGWIPTDVATLNLLAPDTWSKFMSDASVDIIFAEHVWEHLTFAQGEQAAATCHRFVRSGGRLRVAVPDGYHPDEWFIRMVKPGGFGAGADDHKVLYDHKTLSKVLSAGGFERIELLEYYDEAGEFHAVDWDVAFGKVRRSIRFDDRKTEAGLPFTSVIIDAIKA